MGMLCNFGECEIPKATPKELDFETGESVTEVEFDYIYRSYEMSVKTEAMRNPEIQFKVDQLCKHYSIDELNSSIHDLEWEEISAKRSFCNALKDNGGDNSYVSEMKAKMELVLIRLTTLRLALEQKEMTQIGD